MKIYKTLHGDTWDIIVYKVCGNEYAMKDIMEANKEHLGTVIFNAGVEIVIPEKVVVGGGRVINNPWG